MEEPPQHQENIQESMTQIQMMKEDLINDSKDETQHEMVMNDELQKSEFKIDGMIALDFNRRVSNNQHFSMTKVKKQLKNQDISSWAYLIQAPQDETFCYPASLEIAKKHQENCYLQPGINLIAEDSYKKKVNIWFIDWYEFLTPLYGITIPLYFSFIKVHIIVLVMIGSVFGIYFCRNVLKFCDNQYEKSPKNCDYSQYYLFLTQDDFLEALNGDKDLDLWTYYWLALTTYVIIILTPFYHEIMMKYYQVKYWQFDPQNNVVTDDRALYVKHMPKKMTEREIQKTLIQKAKNKNGLINQTVFNQNESSIEEMVYIYDIQPIQQLNEKRKITFLQLLQISDLIKQSTKSQELFKSNNGTNESPQLILDKEKFTTLISELMIQTKEIELYLQQGLPFTNKVILKMKTQEQTDAVYKIFYRTYFDSLKSKIRLMLQLRQEQKEDELYRQSSDFGSRLSIQQRQNTDLTFTSQHSKGNDLMESACSDDSFFDESSLEDQSQNNVVYSKQTLKDLVDTNSITQEALQRLETIKQREKILLDQDDINRHIHIQQGFREDEIFWMNVGTPSLQRFTLRVLTLTVSILMTGFCMAIFELLFYWQNYQKQNHQVNNLGSQILVHVVTIIIALMSILSTMTVLIMTGKSRRSTYSLQAYNIINYMTIQQTLFIQSFPMILVFTEWKGLSKGLPIYNLLILCRTRMIIKCVIHLLHARMIVFCCRRRKITKNFKGSKYFQNQLNLLMTPPLFPIRARLFFIFFIYNTGCLMIYLTPYLLLWCIGILTLFLFYDRYSITRVFIMDKKFNFILFSYLVRVIAIIMIPFHTFVYVSIFRQRNEVIETNALEQIGLSIGIFAWLFYIFLGRKIANFFVFNLIGVSYPIEQHKNYISKTYYESYSQYFQSIGIAQLTDVLVKMFKKLEFKQKGQ